MPKILKRLLLAVILLVVLLFIGLYFIDDIAKGAIEHGGSYALGVDTRVESCSIGLVSGAMQVKQLAIANPKGFKAKQLLQVSKIEGDLPLQNLFGDPIEMKRLSISGIHMSIEQNGGSSNYGKLLDNLKQFEGKQESQEQEGKRFIIRELVIAGTQVDLNLLPIPGGLSHLNVKVPEIRLKDVGAQGQAGVQLSELAGILVKSLLSSLAGNVGGALPAGMLKDLTGRLGNLASLKDQGISILKGLGGGVLEGLGKTGSQALQGGAKSSKSLLKKLDKPLGGLKNAAQGLKGLLGGKKKT